MLELFLTVPGAIFAIGLLVVVHEWGHFVMGRVFGVQAKVFSIGFGPRLWSFEWGGTEYRLSWLPFGGYVRWAGADPFMEGGVDDAEAAVPADRQFMGKPAWQRLMIMFAGPAVNLALPFFLFTLLMVSGDPQPLARLGAVAPGTPAAAAGLLPGDRVIAVDGHSIHTWPDLVDALEAGVASPVVMEVERESGRVVVRVEPPRGGARETDDLGLDPYAPAPILAVDDPQSPAALAGLVTGEAIVAVGGTEVRDFTEIRALVARAGDRLSLTVRNVDGDERQVVLAADPAWGAGAVEVDDEAWRRWGLAPGWVTIGAVSADSAASRAGLQLGDRVLAVGGRPVRTWDDVTAGVAAAGQGEGEQLVASPIEVVVRRGGEVLTLSATPTIVRDTDERARYRWRPLLGIGPTAGLVGPEMVPRSYPLAKAVPRAMDATTQLAASMLQLLGGIVTQEVAASETIGGPVAMFQQAKAAAQEGLRELVRMAGMLSLSLGIINLLPVPVLDGGQILIYGAEWLRGRPLPLVIRERAQQVGVIFLVALMFAVFVNDIYRTVTG